MIRLPATAAIGINITFIPTPLKLCITFPSSPRLNPARARRIHIPTTSQSPDISWKASVSSNISGIIKYPAAIPATTKVRIISVNLTPPDSASRSSSPTCSSSSGRPKIPSLFNLRAFLAICTASMLPPTTNTVIPAAWSPIDPRFEITSSFAPILRPIRNTKIYMTMLVSCSVNRKVSFLWRNFEATA